MSAEINLKSKNAPQLWAFFLFNASLFVLLFFAGYLQLINYNLKLLLSFRSAGIIIAPVILFIVNGLLSSDMKAILVFWRFKNTLPGARAFTRYGVRDPRVDMRRLESTHGPLPIVPREQNQLWYRLYKACGSDTAVMKSHKDFLKGRDIAAISFLYIVFAGIPMLFLGQYPLNCFYIGFLLLQYVLIVIVAQNHGKRFVTNVLAFESAK